MYYVTLSNKNTKNNNKLSNIWKKVNRKTTYIVAPDYMCTVLAFEVEDFCYLCKHGYIFSLTIIIES